MKNRDKKFLRAGKHRCIPRTPRMLSKRGNKVARYIKLALVENGIRVGQLPPHPVIFTSGRRLEGTYVVDARLHMPRSVRAKYNKDGTRTAA